MEQLLFLKPSLFSYLLQMLAQLLSEMCMCGSPSVEPLFISCSAKKKNIDTNKPIYYVDVCIYICIEAV